MKDPLRVAIIGTGFGVSTQLPGFRAAGCTVVSLTGTRAEKTARLAGEHGIPHALSSSEEAVHVGDPDLVCVTTPPAAHLAPALAALRAGRHCLLEKPMALDTAEALQLAEAAAAAGSLAFIDHQLRALPAFQAARRQLAAGELGTPLEVRVTLMSNARLDSSARWDWRASAAQGGGLLAAIGSHVIDTLQWWMGPIVQAQARLACSIATLPDDRGSRRPVETEDCVDIWVSFAGGAIGTIGLTLTAGQYTGLRWTVVGTDRALTIGPSGRLFVARRGGDYEEVSFKPPREPPGRGPRTPGQPERASSPNKVWNRAFFRFARDLAAGIRDGAELPYAATFADGVRTQRIIDAVRSSARTSRAVTIDHSQDG